MNLKKQSLACIVFCALVLTSLPFRIAAQTKVKKIKIRGYITNLVSPTSFEIDEYKVTKDESVVLDFENQGVDIQFKPEDIRVGTEVAIEGMYNEDTDELKATKVTVDMDQFRKLKNTTVLTRDARGIERIGDSGWQGVLWADGRRIRIEPTTQVRFELNKSEKKEAATQAKSKKDSKKDAKVEATEDTAAAAAPETDDDEFTNSEPLKSISDVRAGMYTTYEGVEQPDGTILASRIVFMKDEMEKGEANLWKSFKMKEKAPNFTEGNPGQLSIAQVGKFKLLPNKEVQDYVQRLGDSLVPAYQKALPDNDPQKRHFKFYVISEKVPNAFSLANGVIVIHSGMITMLENEAQLAAVLAHEIAHSTQEHTWRQMNKDKGKRTAIAIGGIAAALLGAGALADVAQLTLAAMVNGYSRRLENQSDRIGLEYMVAAGYDPREAPRVWKLMAKKYGDAPTNFFWSSHANNATRRSFLMIEIRNNYSGLDMTTMKRGDENEYEKIVLWTKDAAAKKKKIKVTAE